jgi:hypothetical protein
MKHHADHHPGRDCGGGEAGSKSQAAVTGKLAADPPA